MMRTASLISQLGWLIPLVGGVFVDEAFQTDYHYALLGIPREQTTFFHRPQSTSTASLLYTLSEKSVVGAINPKNGSLIWRQRLSPSSASSPGFLRAGEHQDHVISAVDGEVTAWDAWNGKAVWSNGFADATIRDLEVLELEDRLSTKGAKDAVVLFESGARGIVRRLDGRTGDVRWEFHDDRYDMVDVAR